MCIFKHILCHVYTGSQAHYIHVYCCNEFWNASQPTHTICLLYAAIGNCIHGISAPCGSSYSTLGFTLHQPPCSLDQENSYCDKQETMISCMTRLYAYIMHFQHIHVAHSLYFSGTESMQNMKKLLFLYYSSQNPLASMACDQGCWGVLKIVVYNNNVSRVCFCIHGLIDWTRGCSRF